METGERDKKREIERRVKMRRCKKIENVGERTASWRRKWRKREEDETVRK